MLNDAKVRLEEQCRADYTRKAKYINEYQDSEERLRRMAEEEYEQKLQYERDLRRLSTGSTAPAYLQNEQQSIMNTFNHPREPLDRPDSQSPPLFPRAEDYTPRYTSASASASSRATQSGYRHLRTSSSVGRLGDHPKPLSSASRYATQEAPAAAPDPGLRKREAEARKQEAQDIREARAVNERLADEVRQRTEVLSHWPVESRSDGLAFLQSQSNSTQEIAKRPTREDRVQISRDMHIGAGVELILKQQKELREQQRELKQLAEDLRRREAELTRREEVLRSGRADNDIGRSFQEEVQRRDEALARQLQEDEVRRARAQNRDPRRARTLSGGSWGTSSTSSISSASSAASASSAWSAFSSKSASTAATTASSRVSSASTAAAGKSAYPTFSSASAAAAQHSSGYSSASKPTSAKESPPPRGWSGTWSSASASIPRQQASQPSSRSSSIPRSGTTSSASTSRATAPPPTPPPPPPPPPQWANWAKRQEEFVRSQQEAFKREQERLARARGVPQISKAEAVALIAKHDAAWMTLPASVRLGWDTLPWPVLRAPAGAEEITGVAVEAYVRAPDEGRTARDRVRELLRRWHPDRFETKLLPLVEEEERERVKEGAGAVVRALNECLTRLNSGE